MQYMLPFFFSFTFVFLFFSSAFLSLVIDNVLKRSWLSSVSVKAVSSA